MTHVLRILVCACGLLLLPQAARAQTAADSAGVLLGVATQLQAEGQHNLARSLLDLIVKRYAQTPAAAEAQRLLAARATPLDEQGGRTELMVWATTYGLALGAAIPAALDVSGPEPYGIGLIVGGPAGFLAGRAYAKSRPLTEGQARAITFGGTWGAAQGLGWAYVFEPGATEYCDEFTGCWKTDDPDAQPAIAMTIAGSLVGIGVGAALSQKNITPGTATTVNFGGLWGSWYGTALAILADQQGDARLTSALIGGNLGIVGAAFGAPKWQLSRQRARLISISGVAGLLAGLGTLLIVQPDDDQSIAIPMASSAGGLALGAYWTRNMDPERIGFDVPGFEPSIQPIRVERVRNGRLERRPALGITLIQARF